jgi:hypothetical protein
LAPLFGRTLQVSRNRRGKDLTCIYTDERPDLARELPNWMFEEKYCAGMSVGRPQVSIEGSERTCAPAGGRQQIGEAGFTIESFQTEGGLRDQEKETGSKTTRVGSRTAAPNNVSGAPEREGD